MNTIIIQEYSDMVKPYHLKIGDYFFGEIDKNNISILPDDNNIGNIGSIPNMDCMCNIGNRICELNFSYILKVTICDSLSGKIYPDKLIRFNGKVLNKSKGYFEIIN